jgi:type VI secretion system protein ImpL
MWLWILLGGIVVAGIWVSFAFLPIPLWIPIVVTAFVILTILGVYLFRRLRAFTRAASLERALLAQAAGHADAARPDRRAEILALQAQMKQAIGALKRTKLARSGGHAALYALPWYVIAGPPAAGKTTALEQSGLKFSSAGGGGSKIRGTAGTRNCDWWFSQEAILLDTAGRFTTEDDDRPEWFSFLDTVRKFRPEKPLDGLVVALSVSELVAMDGAQIEELAAKIRARIDEVMDRLEVALPVYVMFTKVDLVAGFVEFWGDLSKQQRGQAWGAAFALDDDRLGEPARAFEEEFDLLVSGLHRRVLDRLPKEKSPETRSRILQFPVEFRSLRSPLAQFVDELCRQDAYRETPLLRGFYFTSGTQVGRPIDRVLSNMMRGFALPQVPAADRTSAAAQSQSYFVTDVFRSIIFPDRNAAVSSEMRLRRRARRQAVVVVGGLALTLAVVVPAVVSHLSNVDLVDSTMEAVTGSPGAEKGKGAQGAAAKVPLDNVLGELELLDKKRNELTVPGFIGPRAAPPLYKPVRALYGKRVRSVVEGPVREQVLADVGTVGSMARTDASTFESAYNDLKLYLMLTAPTHLDAEWATPRLSDKWARALRTTEESRVRDHVRFYLDGLAANPSSAWPADEGKISRARLRLAKQPLEELQYSWLVGNARGAPPIGPEQVFYGTSARYATARANVEVPGYYTKLGWDQIRAALEQPANDLVTVEKWVLGDTTRLAAAEEQKADVSRLRDLYFVRYEKAWTDFLAGLSVQPPADLGTAIEELRALGESDGPYQRLFRILTENVRLDMGPTTLLGKALEKGKDAIGSATDKITGRDAGAEDRTVSSVERRFKSLVRFAFGDGGPSKAEGGPPTALSQYLAQLATLEVSLMQLAETKTAPTTEFEVELARTKAAVTRLFSGFDPETRLLIEPLLMNPIRGSQTGVAVASHSMLSDKWRAEVWTTWSAKLASRYPFAESKDEVALADFADFFRPQAGTVAKFVAQSLADKLERSGSAYTPKNAADPVPFRGDFLRCLNVAQEISDAAFGATPEVSVPFFVRLEPSGADIAETTFQIGSQLIVYRNEPERWFPALWPAKEGGNKGAAIQVKGNGFNDQVLRVGDFGMFRLLEAGNLRARPGGDGSVMVASFTLARPGQPPVSIQLKPSKPAHPFNREFFRRLRCPPDVTAEGGSAGDAVPGR